MRALSPPCGLHSPLASPPDDAGCPLLHLPCLPPFTFLSSFFQKSPSVMCVIIPDLLLMNSRCLLSTLFLHLLLFSNSKKKNPNIHVELASLRCLYLQQTQTDHLLTESLEHTVKNRTQLTWLKMSE